MPANLFIPFLLGGMILTGSSNSLWSKWQDMQCVENCGDPNPSNRVLFEQPVWQTLQMFVGEMLCFLPVIYTWLKSRRHSVHNQTDSGPDLHNKFEPLQGWKILLLWIPAACDLTGTTLMNVGLLYTPVSIFQMTRGALVLFVGIFSVVFLRRRLWLYQWISLIIVMAGVALVGYSGSLIKGAIEEITPLLARALGNHSLIHSSAEEPELSNVLVGVFFILFAQIFTATQFVVEEKILARYSVSPLVAVGYEGLFGTLSILLFVPILAIPSVSALSPFFDLPRGWYQMVNTPAVLYSSFAICISISLFNFFGLSVTRHVSATARSLTDTCRTISIWFISLGLGWEKLLFPISILQVLGFSLLVYGTFLFNNLVKPPPCLSGPHGDAPVLQDEEEGEALLTGP
jgi:drug/metabolite transporter (DMT)-like permease